MRDDLTIVFHNMRRRLLLGTLVCLLFFNILLGVCFHKARAATDGDDNGYSQISIFAKAVQLIRQDYVDGNKTSYHDLITAAMKGMLASLDPHSQFMDPDTFATCKTTRAAVSTASGSRFR